MRDANENVGWIGRVVGVAIDRPLGSVHPRYADRVYPVNYGFVPGTRAGDGDEIDAYVLGIDTPLARFEGRCIAVIHRRDDVEDKLVVVTDGTVLSDSDIRAATAFQERFFDSVILR